MKSFQELMATYQAEHQSKISKLMHYIGIPAIIFSLFILLNWVNLDFGTVWKVSFSWLLLIAAAIYYFWLGQYKLASITTIVMILLLLIASWIAGPYPSVFGIVLFLILFFGGWIFLFAGHGVEKSKPAFIKSLWQIMIAPLFLIDELMSVCGLGSQFDQPKHKPVHPNIRKGPSAKKPQDDTEDKN